MFATYVEIMIVTTFLWIKTTNFNFKNTYIMMKFKKYTPNNN